MSETSSEILTRLLSDIDDKYDKSVGSVIYDTQRPLSLEAEKLYTSIEKVLDRAFVSTATGKDLDVKLSEIGLTRKPAAYASGTVTFSGTEGAVVPLGTKVISDILTFTTDEEAIIGSSGSVDTTAVCDTAGTVGNVTAGTITGVESTISGITDVTNTCAFTGGYDEETDEQARERYIDVMTKPPASGNRYSYEAWAKEVTGVGDAKCVPIWDGPGTVKVIIIDSDRTAADDALKASVEAHIEALRPIGATVTVVSATPLSVAVSATVTVQSGYTISEIKSNIEDSISKYLKSIAFEADYVSYAQIGSCILHTEGVVDYSGLTVNSGTQNITVDADELAVLGVVTLE